MKSLGALALIMISFSFAARAQVVLYSNSDSAKLEITGYADMYYGYDFLRPKDDTEPYVYSSTKHNELDINVGFVNFMFTSERSRASFTPAIGTLIEINYAPEPSFWRHLYECYAGVKPFKKHNWWVDAGVFGSPYTNESVVSMDHITYTRSLGSENSPYYLSGLRSTHEISDKWKFTWYYLNGWQRIRKINEKPAFGSDLEFKPNKKWVLNWTTFAGDSRYDSMPNLRNRFFTDIHATFNQEGRFTAALCITGGRQYLIDSVQTSLIYNWGSAALQLRYRFNPKHSVAAKYDAYADPNEVILQNVAGDKGFQAGSVTLNYSYAITPKALFRVEARRIQGKQRVFINHTGNPTRTEDVLVTSLALRF